MECTTAFHCIIQPWENFIFLMINISMCNMVQYENVILKYPRPLYLFSLNVGPIWDTRNLNISSGILLISSSMHVVRQTRDIKHKLNTKHQKSHESANAISYTEKHNITFMVLNIIDLFNHCFTTLRKKLLITHSWKTLLLVALTIHKMHINKKGGIILFNKYGCMPCIKELERKRWKESLP